MSTLFCGKVKGPILDLEAQLVYGDSPYLYRWDIGDAIYQVTQIYFPEHFLVLIVGSAHLTNQVNSNLKNFPPQNRFKCMVTRPVSQHARHYTISATSSVVKLVVYPFDDAPINPSFWRLFVIFLVTMFSGLLLLS